MKTTFSEKLFYISAMKGINNKIKILYRTAISKNSTIVVQSYLKETMTSSLLRKSQLLEEQSKDTLYLKE